MSNNCTNLCIRTVNGVNIAVDIHSPNKILFEKDFAQKHNLNPDNTDMKTIFKVIKGDTQMIPLSLTWELTNRCNLQCEFCYIHNHVKSCDIAFETAKPYLESLISKGLLHVVLTGGECTLNKDFIKIYTFLKSRGVLVTVYTNAAYLSDSVLNVFKRCMPRKVEISIYDRMCKDDRPYKNALRLKELGIDVTIKSTVTILTYQYFSELEKWCNDNGFDFKFDTDINDAYDAEKTSVYQLPHNMKHKFDQTKYHSTPLTERKPLRCFDCGSGSSHIHINSKFELGLCIQADKRFELLGTDMDTAYAELVDFVLCIKGKSFENCTNCFAKAICKMCYAKAIKQYDSDGNLHLIADREFCKATQKKFMELYPNEKAPSV